MQATPGQSGPSILLSTDALSDPLPDEPQKTLSTPRASARRTLFDATQPIIMVEIGNGPTATLSIYEHLLRDSSPVFRAHVDDARPRMRFELPSEDPDVFAIYVDWLYTRDFTLCDHNKSITASERWDLLF